MRRVPLLAVLPAFLLAFILMVRFRPRSLARFNRAVTNRITGRFAGRVRGFGIVLHRGRVSGRLYRTPVNVFPVPGGFMIALTYGRGSQWVGNVRAAGGCTLESEGRVYHLADPAFVHDPRHRRLPAVLRFIPRLAGVTDYLRLSISDPASEAAAST